MNDAFRAIQSAVTCDASHRRKFAPSLTQGRHFPSFILLTRLDNKEVNELIKKWFDGDNLEALLHRFGASAP